MKINGDSRILSENLKNRVLPHCGSRCSDEHFTE